MVPELQSARAVRGKGALKNVVQSRTESRQVKGVNRLQRIYSAAAPAQQPSTQCAANPPGQLPLPKELPSLGAVSIGSVGIHGQEEAFSAQRLSPM